MEERTLLQKIFRFFDKLEDRVRRALSHRRIVYGFAGGIGVVLFWRGVWHTADYISLSLFGAQYELTTTDLAELWDGLFSALIGTVLLLITGLFVSSFIGNEILISGLRGEKKIAEKTEDEVKEEERELSAMKREVREIREMMSALMKKEDIKKERQ